MYTLAFQINNWNALFPDLTNFRRLSSCHCYDRNQSLLRELPIPPAMCNDTAQCRRILKWLVATGLAISKQSTAFNSASNRNNNSTCLSKQWNLKLRYARPFAFIPSQCCPDWQAHLWLGPELASHPAIWGILDTEHLVVNNARSCVQPQSGLHE